MAAYKNIFSELIGKTGLINSDFYLLDQKKFVPKGLYNFAAIGKNMGYAALGSINEVLAGSINLTFEGAVYGAIGEYVERISSAISKNKKLTYGSYNNLTAKGLNLMDPNLISAFAPWQLEKPDFIFQKLGYDDKIHWVEGRDYFTDSKIYLPAALVTLEYLPREIRYVIQTSTGQAAGPDLNNAIKGGLFETIERHNWCDLWFNQSKRDFITYTPKMVMDYYPCDEINTLFNNRSVQIKIFDLGLKSPIETIVVFLSFSYHDKLYYSLGAASRFDKKDAIIKACTEAYQGVDYAIEVGRTSNWDEDYEKVLPTINDYKDNFRFYNVYSYLKPECPLFVEAMDTKPTVDNIITHKGKLKSMDKDEIKKLGEINHMYYTDLTVEEWKLPFSVAKVILPEWALMSPSFEYPFLGNEIFSDVNNLFLKLPNCFP